MTDTEIDRQKAIDILTQMDDAHRRVFLEASKIYKVDKTKTPDECIETVAKRLGIHLPEWEVQHE